MFTKRIIPCLDCKNGRVVKGTNFVNLKDAGDPVEVASMYDKLSVNSAAIMNPTLISEAADKFGSQCVVVAIDAKRAENGSGWSIYKNGGRVDMHMDAVEWAMKAEKLGCDIELTRTIAENVSIPVIASGGAGNMEHFYDAFTEGKADAALAASLFHYKEMQIMDLKKYLSEREIAVRMI